jgi:hypothetical protein
LWLSNNQSRHQQFPTLQRSAHLPVTLISRS